LKQSNRGDSRSAGVQARCRVFERDPADGQDWNSYCVADLLEARQALWRAKDGFRRRGKYGAEENVIGALAFGLNRGFERMARRSDQKVRRNACVSIALRRATFPRSDRRDRQGIFSEMYARRSRGKGNVEAIVDDNPRSRRTRHFDGGACQTAQLLRLQILFADLDPVHSCRCNFLDEIPQRLDRMRIVACAGPIIGSKFRDGESPPVGDAAEDRFSVGSQQSRDAAATYRRQ